MRRTSFKLTAALVAAPTLLVGIGALAAPTAHAATARNGVCESGEFCLYYNSGEAGSLSDFTTSISDYGATQPSCYDFKGAGAGKGLCVKNHAASVWNRTSKTVTVYYNSGYAGHAQNFAAGAKGNLDATLKNNNAGHRIGAAPATVRGIDVSNNNTTINWASQHSAGVKFAYAKATEGSTWTDPTFSRNYSGARSAGIIRGAYHFANPAGASGKTQADFFISHGGAWRADGYTLPGALDVEGSCYSKTPAAMVTWIKAFVAEYKLKEGRTPVIYTNRAWWQDCTGNSTAFHSSALWFAHPTTVGTLPGGWTKQTIWQYGASGGIDQNKFNGSATALKAFANNS
jgi:Lyzozyme M1 (1,4-beta-N-acetylmuramidase)